MRISELRDQCEAILAQHGDIEISVDDGVGAAFDTMTIETVAPEEVPPPQPHGAVIRFSRSQGQGGGQGGGGQGPGKDKGRNR